MKRTIALILFVPVLAWAQSAPVTTQQVVQTNPVFGSPCSYRASALRDHAVGKTDIEFRVTIDPAAPTDRKIDTVTVFRSSGNQDLDGAAVQCVSSWRLDAKSSAELGFQRGQIVWSLPATASIPGIVPAGAFVTVQRAALIKGAPCDKVFHGSPITIKPGFSGMTTVAVHVTAKGEVSGVDLVESSGNANLDGQAESCISGSWHFRAAMEDGQAVSDVKKYAVRWMTP